MLESVARSQVYWRQVCSLASAAAPVGDAADTASVDIAAAFADSTPYS